MSRLKSTFEENNKGREEKIKRKIKKRRKKSDCP